MPNQRGSHGDLMLPSAVAKLLPTPAARDAKGPNVGERNGTDGLAKEVEKVNLLPTPAAGLFNDGEDVEDWDARRKRLKAAYADHGTGAGNGMGVPLSIAIRSLPLLKTPTAQLAINGGSQHPEKRAAGGHGPTLADEVEQGLPVLPTPTASVAADPAPWKPGVEWWLQSRAARSLAAMGNLLAEGGGLLPTPAASDGKGSGAAAGRARGERTRTAGDSDLPEIVGELLPTPVAPGGGGKSRSGDRQDEPLLPGVVAGLLPTPTAQAGKHGEPAPSEIRPQDGANLWVAVTTVDWGKYARAICRWEQITGRLVPNPLEPGRNGKGRLSPAFVEWMMGLPAGWVTEVDGLSRNAQLKALGNGVVPQQAFLALQVLVARILVEDE